MSRRVLLIDDDHRFLAQLTRSLARRGFEVESALDSLSALRTARLFRPNVVLLDLRLGDESGMHIIPRLRSGQETCRIIVLTGYASISTAVEAIKRGANDYLPKPAHLSAILSALDGSKDTDLIERHPPERMAPLANLQWEHIQQALVDSEGNVSEAARRLGMHRRTLQRKLSKRPTVI